MIRSGNMDKAIIDTGETGEIGIADDDGPRAAFMLNPRKMTVEEMHQVVVAALEKAGYKPRKKMFT
jgi:hypothetical protein